MFFLSGFAPGKIDFGCWMSLVKDFWIFFSFLKCQFSLDPRKLIDSKFPQSFSYYEDGYDSFQDLFIVKVQLKIPKWSYLKQ